jgi:hypothetical protein
MSDPDSFIQNLYKQMALYGFADIHYVNHSPVGSILDRDYPRRWRIGVWTGPDRTIMALKQCATEEEALVWETPLGWDIADALNLAIERLKFLRISSCP